MSRGARRNFITLDTPGPDIPDGDGGYTHTWLPLVPPSRWAEIKPATTRDLERMTANTSLTTATHLVRFDYHPQVTTQTRIHFGARVFEVINAPLNPDERNIDTIVVCAEMVP